MMKTLKGFTLAEVLTTLMVIGVVAAMTIPTLMNSTSDQQLKVAYKKAMSVLGQGVQLMVAKETECNIYDNQSLAECFANNVLSGSLVNGKGTNGGVHTNDRKNNVVITSDGIAYQFFFRNSSSRTNTSPADTFDSICGTMTGLLNQTTMLPEEGTYTGANAQCMVMVDVNGLNKGAKQFALDGDAAWSTLVGTGGVLAAAQGNGTSTSAGGVEQQPIIITGTGVKPAYSSNSSGNLNKGYSWMYGNTSNPWSGS